MTPETLEEARAPNLAEVLASPHVSEDPNALWATKRPTIARQACVDFMVGKSFADEVHLPCGGDPGGGEGCPENQSCLVAKRKEVGSLMYDREFLTTPRAATSSLFPRERMEPSLRYDQSLVPRFGRHSNRFWVVNGWDVAWSERTGGDYLAKISAVLDRKTGRKKLLDINRWQALTFRQQVGLMKQEHLVYHANLTVIEEAGAQSIWTQETRHEGEEEDVQILDPDAHGKTLEMLGQLKGIAAVGHPAGDKKDFVKGVPGLILDLERRVWEMPMLEGSYHHEEMLNFLIELEAFGWHDDKLEGVGEHDDTVMAWWHNWWGLEWGARMITTSASPAGRKLPSGSI